MFEWKVEEMALLNQTSSVYFGNEKIYDCESKVSREDKIAFVDSMQEGKCSYLLALIEKFEQEKDSLPKDKWGEVRTTSLQAWVRRYDAKYQRTIIDIDYHYGKYRLLGTERYITSNTEGQYDTYEDLVNELFHRQLKACEKEERKYFKEHDEYEILKQKFRDRKYTTTFGVRICDWSTGKLTVADETGEKERELTIDELKDLLAKYEQLDAFVKELTAKTHIVY